MRYLIFGTGDYYNRYKKWFAQQEIVALLDNSEKKQHTVMDGLNVLAPSEGIKLDYDIIVILSFYVKQMKQQLISLGVDEKKIYHFYDMHKLFGHMVPRIPLQYYLNAEEIVKSLKHKSTKILLMSDDLTLGGPSIALLHAAAVLKRQGYMVVYASMWDGALKEKLIELNIPVIVDENLPILTMRQTEWVNTFSLVICNTLNFHVFLSERDTAIPIIWWLHDARFFYDGVSRHIMKQIRFENLKAVSVGPVPQMAVREFLPDLECEELLYGVDDAGSENVAKSYSNTVRFITIGFLEDRKGQDILVQAVKLLHRDLRHRCVFYIVGHGETLFGEKIRNESAGVHEIIFTGSVSRKKIHELLAVSDVLICPSKQDPMPTVAAEAMMHSVPCIMSDAAGTASYICDGKNGLVFRSGDTEQLASKIAQCVQNMENTRHMGQEARKLYEKYFSMEVFEDNLLRIVEHVLGEHKILQKSR